MTPFGLDGDSLASATPLGYEGDDPTLRQAATSLEREDWLTACDAEFDNLQSHHAYELVPEDSLPTWDPVKRRASEVTNTLWVLKQKRGGLNERTKKKGRISTMVPCKRPPPSIMGASLRRSRRRCVTPRLSYLWRMDACAVVAGCSSTWRART
eukprot:4347121-Prymnesium_polylepis.1